MTPLNTVFLPDYYLNVFTGSKARGRVILMTHVDFYCGLLLRNLLQQQKSVSNHAKMQLQQNVQQTWLQVTQTMMLF